MNIQFRQIFLLILVPPPWFFSTFLEHGSNIIASATLCGPEQSTCFPAPLPQPCHPPLIPPPSPPAPPLPQPHPCPMPCSPTPHTPLPPQPQLPCPLPCPLPPSPPPTQPQLPCPVPCSPSSPCPLPLPRLTTPNVPCTPLSTYQQPFLPQPIPQQSLPNNPIYPQQNQYHLISSQVPYSQNQQLPPPSYATRPMPQTYQIPMSSPYSPQPGLSYGYGYGKQSPMTSPYYPENLYQNPIPAKEKFVHTPEERQEQQQIVHEKVKDPFEKIEDNEERIDAENKSGGDDRIKTTNTRQRINPQLQRDGNFDSYAVRYARPTITPVDVPLPKPMPPIIYPTTIPVYQQQQPPPLPSTIYQPSPQQWQQPYSQMNCPPCPVPTPQPIPALPPIQNCCLRCGVPCKTTALFKSYGVRTVTKPYLHSGISSVDELAFHTKKRDENKCNDEALGMILGEAYALKMNLAKEKIMERIEQRLLPPINVTRHNILFHVVCAPKMLEYIIHSEKFCAGDVADGVCFVFRTG